MTYICEWLDGGTRQVEWPTEELALSEAQRLATSGIKWVVVWELDDDEGQKVHLGVTGGPRSDGRGEEALRGVGDVDRLSGAGNGAVR